MEITLDVLLYELLIDLPRSSDDHLKALAAEALRISRTQSFRTAPTLLRAIVEAIIVAADEP